MQGRVVGHIAIQYRDNKWLISQFAIAFCVQTTPILVESYSSRICPGLINDQMYEMALPVLFDELLAEETLCTFILELCDTEKWQSIDVNQWVFEKVNEKAEPALSNDYVN